MITLRRWIFSLIICTVIGEALICQDKTHFTYLSKKEIRVLTENKYGLDDILVNGLIYCPKNVNANGDAYFEYANSESNTLFIKGRSFVNRNIFYDIVLDQLILQVKLQNYFEPRIVLNSSFVDSFSLGNAHFINLAILDESLKRFGYFEKIYSGRELFLKKYKKRFIDSFDLKNPFGKFSTQWFSYYILYNEKELLKVNKKRDLINFYSKHKKAIRKYIRKNKIRYRKASNKELYKLLNFCHDVSK